MNDAEVANLRDENVRLRAVVLAVEAAINDWDAASVTWLSADKREEHSTSDAEGDAWDALWEADAVWCTCPSCNYYAPDYAEHQNEPCVMRTIITGIADARANHVAARVEAACAEALAERPALTMPAGDPSLVKAMAANRATNETVALVRAALNRERGK